MEPHAQPSPPPAPRRLQRYLLGEPVGAGALGRAYAATEEGTGAAVMIWLLGDAAPPLDDDAGRRAAALRRLQHPGLARVLSTSTGAEGGEPAHLVGEFLAGESLRERLLRQRRLGPEEAIELGRQVAEALAAAHAQGLWHGGLGAEGLLFTADLSGERVVVRDLGAAVLAGEHRRGLAPEQCEAGQPVDAAADVYGLGALLYEALTGAPLFAGDEAQRRRQHLAAVVPSLTDRAPQTPRALSRLVHDMLARTAAARPTMAQVAERLQALPQQLAAPAAARPTAPPRIRVLPRPAGPRWGGLAAGLLSCALGGLGVLGLWRRGAALEVTAEASGTRDGLTAVCADAGSGDLWAVGRAGVVLRHSGGRWVAQASGTQEDLYGVAAREGRVVAVGEHGTVIGRGLDPGGGRAGAAGGGLRALASPVEGRLEAAWLGPRSLYVVGQRGALLRGESGPGGDPRLRQQPSGTTAHLRGVHGSGEDDVWAVGGDDDRGVSLHFDGQAWSAAPLPVRLRGVFAARPEDVLAVGGAADGPGVAFRFDGREWRRLAVPDVRGESLLAVAGAWLVGDGGLIVHRGEDGTLRRHWARREPSVNLRGVVALDPRRAVAVGSGGAILRLALYR